MGLSDSFPGHPSLRLVSIFGVIFLLGGGLCVSLCPLALMCDSQGLVFGILLSWVGEQVLYARFYITSFMTLCVLTSVFSFSPFAVR